MSAKNKCGWRVVSHVSHAGINKIDIFELTVKAHSDGRFHVSGARRVPTVFWDNGLVDSRSEVLPAKVHVCDALEQIAHELRMPDCVYQAAVFDFVNKTVALA